MIDKQFIHERDDEWTDSAANEPEEWPEEDGKVDEQCLNIFEQVEQAQLIKPLGKCVTLPNADGVEWKV